jgi:hypothetical protein
MAISCKFQVETLDDKGNIVREDSKLYKDLDLILGKEDLADIAYTKINSDEFKAEFGNFRLYYNFDAIQKKELKDSYTEETAKSEVERINNIYGDGSAVVVKDGDEFTVELVLPSDDSVAKTVNSQGEPLLFYQIGENTFTTDLDKAGLYETPEDYEGTLPVVKKGKTVPIFLNIKTTEDGTITDDDTSLFDDVIATINDESVAHFASAGRGVTLVTKEEEAEEIELEVDKSEEETTRDEELEKLAVTTIQSLEKKLEIIKRKEEKKDKKKRGSSVVETLSGQIKELKRIRGGFKLTNDPLDIAALSAPERNLLVLYKFMEFAKTAIETVDRGMLDIEQSIKNSKGTKKEKKIILRRLANAKDYTSVFSMVTDIVEAIKDREALADLNLSEEALRAEFVDPVMGSINMLNGKYIRLSRPLIADFLNEYNSDADLSKKDIERMLTHVHDDVGFITYLADSLADSNDQVLALVDKVIKKKKADINFAMVTFRNTEMKKAIKDLEKTQSASSNNHEKFYDFMLERDDKGRLTGNYIEKDSPKYKGLTAAQKEFYDLFHENYQEHQKNLPPGFQRRYQLPAILKSGSERAFQDVRGVSSAVTAAGKTLGDLVKRREDEKDYVEVTTDEQGREFKFIPIKYTSTISREKDKGLNPEDISLNLMESLEMFMTMSKNYSGMRDVATELMIVQDLVAERRVTQKKGTKKMVTGVSKLIGGEERKEVTEAGITSNAYKQLKTYLDMQMFGERKKDEGNLLFDSLDKAKTLDLLGKYTSIRSLAFNLYSGINNVSVANVMNMIEGAGGQFYERKHLRQAKADYAKNIYGFVKDAVSEFPENDLSIWMDSYDIFQEFDQYGNRIPSKSFIKRMAGKVTFIMQSSGEHMIQTEVAVAMARSHRIVKGKIMSYQDWLEANPSKPDTKASKKEFEESYKTVRESIGVKDGMSWTEGVTKNEMIKFTERIKGVYQYLHGNYSKNDAAALQQKAMGRLLVLFRKWLMPGWKRRWGRDTFDNREVYNQRLGAKTGGYYVVTYRFLSEYVKQVKKHGLAMGMLKENWNKLPAWKKSQIKKTITEFAIGGAVMLLLTLLGSLEGDDEDDWMRSMLVYQLHRLDSEISFYRNLGSVMEVLRSPSAAMSTIEAVGKAFHTSFGPAFNFGEDWMEYERYERGKHKGKTKVGVAVKKLIPYSSQLERILTPYDVAKYLESL